MYVLEVGAAAGGGTLRLGAVAVFIGRAPSNDLIVDHAAISGRHITCWVDDEGAWVEDLRSRNGTRINDDALHGARRVAGGDRITLADAVELRVVELTYPTQGRRWVVRDPGSGASWPVAHDRFRIGPGDDAHLLVPAGVGALLLLDADGALSLASPDGDEVPLADGDAIAGLPFRVALAPAERAATIDVSTASYPYVIRAKIDDTGGPTATFLDPTTERTHMVTAGHRAVLVWMLARQVVAHAAQPALRRGWCDDDDLARGLWGRAAPERQLKFVVVRLRAELRDAGFDPWVIEKRRGALRLRALNVHVD